MSIAKNSPQPNIINTALWVAICRKFVPVKNVDGPTSTMIKYIATKIVSVPAFSQYVLKVIFFIKNSLFCCRQQDLLFGCFIGRENAFNDTISKYNYSVADRQ